MAPVSNTKTNNYELRCCSNTFLAGSLNDCVLLFLSSCNVSCTAMFALVFCYFCSRVLLLLLSRSVLFGLVYCYVCSRVLLFLLSCSVIFALVFCYFCARDLLFLGSCSVSTHTSFCLYKRLLSRTTLDFCTGQM